MYGYLFSFLFCFHLDIASLSDLYTEQLTFDYLRRNPWLQNHIQKELSKLGFAPLLTLKVVLLQDESSISVSDSSDSS